MIRVVVEHSKPKEYYKLLNKKISRYIPLKKKIKNWIRDNPNHADLDIAEDLCDNLKKFITENPKGLEQIIERYRANGFQDRISCPVDENLTDFGKILRDDIFQYKNFRKSLKAKYLSTSLNIKTCLTCNTQRTLTTNQESGEKMLFHLDHYYPQSIFPYLSLSFYNLLPSCASCNLSKSNSVYTLETNIHPYVDSFHQIAEFKINKDKLLEYLIDTNENEEKIEYSIHLRPFYLANAKYETKLNNYLLEYRINEQYVQFKDIAGEIFLKSRYYHKSRRKELRKFFKDENIKITEELIKRFILGNYYQDSDLLKRPLAKFMKDISKEVNLF
jgi:hypothetical protein